MTPHLRPKTAQPGQSAEVCPAQGNTRIRREKESPVTYELHATAIHEAGHAVTAYHFNIPIEMVTIVSDDDSLGQVVHPPPLLILPTDRRNRNRAVKEMMITLYAGMAAERKFNPNAPAFHGECDEEEAWNLPRRYPFPIRGCTMVGDDAFERCLEHRRVEAERLVSRHWSAINRFAQELLAKRTMLREDVEALLEESV